MSDVQNGGAAGSHDAASRSDGPLTPADSSLRVFIVLVFASLICEPVFRVCGRVLPDAASFFVLFGGNLLFHSSLAMALEGAINALANQMIIVDAIWLAWSELTLRRKAVQGAFLVMSATAGGLLGWTVSIWQFDSGGEIKNTLLAGAMHYLAYLILLILALHLARVLVGWTLVARGEPFGHDRPQFVVSTLFAITTATAVTVVLLQAANRYFSETSYAFTAADSGPENILYDALAIGGSALAETLLIACVAIAVRGRYRPAWLAAVLLPTGIFLAIHIGWYVRYEGMFAGGYSLEEFLWENGAMLLTSSVLTVALCGVTFSVFSWAGYKLRRLPRRSTSAR